MNTQKLTQNQEEPASKFTLVQDSPKIMIIDDNQELLEELEKMLTLGGYEVITRHDSYTAFDEVCAAKPDLILLDLKMSPKSGFQVVDELKNSSVTKDIPVIAMTGYFTEKEHILMMKLCGIKVFILKPFNPVNLIGKIEFALGRRKEEYESEDV